MTYQDFLEHKIVQAPESGFDCGHTAINPALKPHQRDAVRWLLKGGRRALFESFGLGKTVQELEFCRLAAEHENGRALIVLPLGVRQEFTRDAVELLHIEPPTYVRNMAEVREAPGAILMTNYERVRDGDIDPTYFAVTSLDEASVLRSFSSKTYQTFLDKFQGVRYKLVATATPSPNQFKELIHYAGYLEIMDTGQALTRFFQRDSTKANHLTLYEHKRDEFWLWVSTWALMITRPSDLGYDDEGYALPPLDVRRHVVSLGYGKTADKDGQIQIMRDSAVSLSEAAREKRDSIDIRVQKAKEIVNSDPEARFILWHDLEAERHALKKAMPEAHTAQITRRVTFSTAEALEKFKNMLLCDWPFLSGKGGTGTNDPRVNNDNILKLNREQRAAVRFFSVDCVAVYFSGELVLVSNPEGYNYSRYTYLPNNGTTESTPAESAERDEEEQAATVEPFYFPAPVEEQAKRLTVGDVVTVYQTDGMILNILKAYTGILTDVKPGTWAQHSGAWLTIQNGRKSGSVFCSLSRDDTAVFQGFPLELPESVTFCNIQNTGTGATLREYRDSRDQLREAINYYKAFDRVPVLDTLQR